MACIKLLLLLRLCRVSQNLSVKLHIYMQQTVWHNELIRTL